MNGAEKIFNFSYFIYNYFDNNLVIKNYYDIKDRFSIDKCVEMFQNIFNFFNTEVSCLNIILIFKNLHLVCIWFEIIIIIFRTSCGYEYSIVQPYPVSPRLSVGKEVEKPEYWKSGIPAQGSKEIEIKTKELINAMKDTCQLAKTILSSVQGFIKVFSAPEFISYNSKLEGMQVWIFIFLPGWYNNRWHWYLCP